MAIIGAVMVLVCMLGAGVCYFNDNKSWQFWAFLCLFNAITLQGYS